MRQEEIIEKYPLLYHELKYLEVPDRWLGVIDGLSAALEREIIQYIKEHPSASHDNPHDSIPCAIQVKEKFGGLRFYMRWQTDRMSQLIRQAEDVIGEMI